MSEAGPSASAPPGRRASSRRRSSLTSASSTNISTHPAPDPVDARRLDLDTILGAMERRNASLLDRLDFVNMADDDIHSLFVTKRVRERVAVLLYPPQHRRRTVQHIREWFGVLGITAQRQKIAEAEQYQILECHNPTIIWDAENGWVQPPEPAAVPPTAPPSPQPPRKCVGVTLGHVEAWPMRQTGSESSEDVSQRREKRLLGFKHFVREGLTCRSRLSQPDEDKWGSYVPPVVGAMTHGHDDDKVCWVIEERPRDVGTDQFQYYNIHAVECSRGELESGKDLCEACLKRKLALIRRFEAAVDLRAEGLDPCAKNAVVQRSGTFQGDRRGYHRSTSRNKTKKLSRRDKAIDKLMEKTSITVPMNPHLDEIFNEDVSTKVKERFLKNEVSKDGVAAYVWDMAVMKHKVAKESGATAVEHCPLTIRLGANVRAAMGYKGGLYDLVAKCCGLPSDRQLRRYKVANTNDPDGLMVSNVRMAKDSFDRKNPNAGRFDFCRHVTMAFDSMHTKGRFEVNHHTNQLVGVAEDAFEEKVIIEEMKMLDQTAKTNDKEKMIIPEIAKHFLVFICTTWQSGQKHQFLAARYALKTISYHFLVRTIPLLANLLVLYGFIVDTIVGDGAPENRAAFKLLAKISAREILTRHWKEDQLQGLPLNFKIGFQHPHPLYRKKVTIVIGGEMPHWVKKFRNAFDNTSRKLTFRGMLMDLQIIYNIWLASGDADTTAGLVRRYNKTHDHFKLNTYLKMRVFLAAQIPSQNTITMIKDFCDAESYEPGFDKVPQLEDYQPMIDIFQKVDRLVDIMNGTGYKNGKHKDVELINSPVHRHLEELFDILRLFMEWKAEHKGKGQSHKYVTSYTHEDLIWMVFGTAAVACLYLDSDGSIAMHQGRSGSDVCEHFFSLIRYVNSNPTMGQCIQGASRVAGNGTLGSGNMFSFNSKANAGKAHLEAADYLAELPSAKPKSNKRQKKK